MEQYRGCIAGTDAATERLASIGRRIAELEDEMKNNPVCNWREDDPNGSMPMTWESECDLVWYLDEGRPADHQMNYCPKCGKPLVDVKFEVEEEDDEDEDE